MTTPYRLIIAGGRNFGDQELFRRGIDWFHANAKPQELHIISGAARGADTMGAEYGRSNGFPVQEFPADWGNLNAPGARIKQGARGPYNAMAGFVRNEQMADAATGVLLFPGGSGTAHMAEAAAKRGLDVYDLRDPANPSLRRAKRGGPRLVSQPLDYGRSWGPDEVLLFTGNPIINNRGGVVMGRGAALQVRDTYPGIDKALAAAIRPGSGLAFADIEPGRSIGWFKVKDHFQDDARLDLISASARELAELARSNPDITYHMNAPGIGAGHLRWQDVQPLLGGLPENVRIYTGSPGKPTPGGPGSPPQSRAAAATVPEWAPAEALGPHPTFTIVPERGPYDIKGMRVGGRTLRDVQRPGDPGWLGNAHKANDAGGIYTRGQATYLFWKDLSEKIESDPEWRQAALDLRGKRIGYYKPDELNHLQPLQEWLSQQSVDPPQPPATRQLDLLEEPTTAPGTQAGAGGGAPPPIPPDQQQRLGEVEPPTGNGPAPAPTNPDKPMAGERWPWILAAAGLSTAAGAGYLLANDR
jgi:hypothetical protein